MSGLSIPLGFPEGVFGGAAFTPASYGTPVIWLKMGVGLYQDTGKTTPATTGEVVGAWENQIAPGTADFTEATNKPLVLASGGVDFDGTNDLLTAGDAVTVGTVAIVAAYDEGAAFVGANPLIAGAAVAAGDLMIVGTSGATVLIENGSYFFGTRIEVNGVDTNEFAPLATLKLAIGWAAAPASKTLILATSNILTGKWGGEIREVLVYSDILSTANRAKLSAALIARHGLG